MNPFEATDGIHEYTPIHVHEYTHTRTRPHWFRTRLSSPSTGQQIRDFTKIFLDSLEQAESSAAIARCFVRVAPFFRMYSTYWEHYTRASDQLRELRATPSVATWDHGWIWSKQFVSQHEFPFQTIHLIQTLPCSKVASFIAKIEANSRCSGLSLASYLIEPVQRVPRYEMLLKELLKNTAPSGLKYSPKKG